MTKILLNALQLDKQLTGIQYHIKNLSFVLNNKKKNIFFLMSKKKYFPDEFTIVSKISNKLLRVVHEQIFLPFYLKNNKFSLYHSPTNTLPFISFTPSIITIHDLLPIMNPKWCQIETVLYYRFILPSSVKKAQKIIAVSEEVKKQIIKRYNIPEQKINVVYNGVSENFRRIKDIEELNNVRTLYNLPESFILFVGAIEPKKNLVRLVEAYKKIITQYNFDIKLVIAGKKGWKCKDFLNKINEPELKDKIILTGYVKEEHLAAIYSLSDLFVFPSLYEGFGIPPLEAMACQTPVIVSNTGALPEITGGKCLQVNPYDVNEIAQGIHQLLTDFDFRTKTITEGYEWSKKFNWEKAAIETIKIYEKVLSENEEYHK